MKAKERAAKRKQDKLNNTNMLNNLLNEFHNNTTSTNNNNNTNTSDTTSTSNTNPTTPTNTNTTSTTTTESHTPPTNNNNNFRMSMDLTNQFLLADFSERNFFDLPIRDSTGGPGTNANVTVAKFSDYAARAFKELRKRFGISDMDYTVMYRNILHNYIIIQIYSRYRMNNNSINVLSLSCFDTIYIVVFGN